MTPSRSPFELHLLDNRFPPLHGLRALAIVSVLQIHVTIILAFAGLLQSPLLYRCSSCVWFGMDLFFILSGFLIGTLLLPREDGQVRGGVLRFYVRRSFRIVPLYYVVLTTLALRGPAVQLAGLPWEYAYLTNYHVFPVPSIMPWAWSLCVEEHFYLAAPLLAALLALIPRASFRLVALTLLWVAAFGVRYAVFTARPVWMPGEMFDALYLRTHTRLDIFVAGVLLAHLQRSYGPRLREALRGFRARLALGAVPVACCAALVGPLATRFDLSTVFAWGTVTSVMYVALVILVLNTDGPVTRWLSSRWFLRFATLGYGVYLVHPPLTAHVVVPIAHIMMVQWHVSLGVTWVCSLALLLVVATATAYVLHLVVEKPALWLRDRVAG